MLANIIFYLIAVMLTLLMGGILANPFFHLGIVGLGFFGSGLVLGFIRKDFNELRNYGIMFGVSMIALSIGIPLV